MTRRPLTARLTGLTAIVLVGLCLSLSGCQWRGLNSLPMPGTQGRGDGSFQVQAQMPDVGYLQQNSRVQLGDVNVGTVTKIERQDWHALITMRLNGNVVLPANATAKLGQTSVLGSLHVELAAPTDAPPSGRLRNGSVIPLASAGAYPTTDQTLSALSLLLNGGGLGQVQDITEAYSTAFAGREQDLKSLITQLDQFAGHLDRQTGDIISSTESFNALVAQFAAQKPVLDKALTSIPDALQVLSTQRDHLTEAFDSFGSFNSLVADSVDQTKQSIVSELNAIGPVVKSIADAGPAATRSLSLFSTFPFPKETLEKWFRGDYANFDVIFDLTLSRIDNSFFTGTRFECNLTELELQWGRTIGQTPSPCTAPNPLVAPYRLDQGP